MEECIPPLLNDPLCHTGVDFRGPLVSGRDVILWDSKAAVMMEVNGVGNSVRSSDMPTVSDKKNAVCLCQRQGMEIE